MIEGAGLTIGNYLLEYRFGPPFETWFEMMERATESVLITLVGGCKFEMPTLVVTNSVTADDPFTYIIGSPPMQINMVGIIPQGC